MSVVRLYRALCRRVRHARYLLGARSESLQNFRRLSGRNILVICYGNIYRSPFAATLLNSRLKGTGWRIRSVGFHDKTDRPCEQGFIELSKQFGVELQDHRSSGIDDADLGWADLVVIMDTKNRNQLRSLGDDVKRKIVWVGAWVGGFRADIQDPYGRSDTEVLQITTRLFCSVEALADQLEMLSAQTNA